MAFYETVFIARQDISAPQAEALADTFSKVIEDHGGAIAKREHWGLRNLSFRIKKNRKGHYVLFNIDAPPSALHEVERQMRIHEDVLRYMTIRVDTLDEKPSAMMQSRSGRDDRGRREGRGRDGGPRDGGSRDGGGRSDRGSSGTQTASSNGPAESTGSAESTGTTTAETPAPEGEPS